MNRRIGHRESPLEHHFLFLCRALGLPEPTREYRFAEPRRWRFDFAWIPQRLAVEVEGGTFVRGRHVRGKGIENDCHKYNAAVVRGWRVLRFTTDDVLKRGHDSVSIVKGMLEAER
jgi:very-short-patch-repair endonuclease